MPEQVWENFRFTPEAWEAFKVEQGLERRERMLKGGSPNPPDLPFVPEGQRLTKEEWIDLTWKMKEEANRNRALRNNPQLPEAENYQAEVEPEDDTILPSKPTPIFKGDLPPESHDFVDEVLEEDALHGGSEFEVGSLLEEPGAKENPLLVSADPNFRPDASVTDEPAIEMSAGAPLPPGGVPPDQAFAQAIQENPYITGGEPPAGWDLTPAGGEPAQEQEQADDPAAQQALKAAEALRAAMEGMDPAAQDSLLKRLRGLSSQFGKSGKALINTLDSALETQQKAAGLQREVDRHKAESKAAASFRAQSIAATHEANARRLEERKTLALNDADAKIEGFRRDFEAMSRQGVRVPPLFIAAQTLTTIGNAIGMGMGAAAGILAGTGGNAVAPLAAMISRQIDKAIDRDLQAQRFGIQLAGQRVDQGRTARAELARRFGDDGMALKALKLLAIEKSQAQLQQEISALGAGDEAQRAVALQVQSELDQKHALARHDVHKTTLARMVPAFALEADVQAKKMQMAAARSAQLAQQAAGMAPAGELIGPGFTLNIKKKIPVAMEGKLREKVEGFNTMDRSLVDAVSAVQDASRTGSWVGKERHEFDRIMAAIVNASRQVHGTGANFTEKEMELVEKEYFAGMRLGGLDMYKAMSGILRKAQKNLRLKGLDMSRAYSDYLDYRPEALPKGVSGAVDAPRPSR